jgi:hypothetical protein
MPRSVYSVVGHDDSSGFNPIHLIKRFTAGAIVMAMVLLGTATIASAATPSSVAFSTTSTIPSATPTWTVVFTTPTIVAAASDTITATFPTGFSLTGAPTVALTAGFSGGTACTTPPPTVTVSGQNATFPLPTGCTLAANTSGTFTLANIVNPSTAATYAASGFTVKTTSDNTAAATSSAIVIGLSSVTFSPGSNVNQATSTWTVGFTNFQVGGALAAAGTIKVTLPSTFVIDGGTVVTLGSGFSNCTAGTLSVSTPAVTIPLANNSGTCALAQNTAATLTISKITNTNSTSLPESNANTGFGVQTSAYATADAHPASGVNVVAGGLAAPTAVTNSGSGAINVAFLADGVATSYTVTSSPGGKTCIVSSTTAIGATSQNCTVGGLTNGTSYTFSVTPSGNGDTNTVSSASASITPQAVLAAPTITSGGAATSTTDQAVVSFTADGIATTYLVNSGTSSPSAGTAASGGSTCTVSNTSTPPTGTQSCLVTGLTPSSNNYFTVTKSGNGETAGVSNASTPAFVGTAVMAVPTAAVTGSQTVKVTFYADGTATAYSVTAVGAAGFSCSVNSATPPTGFQSCTISGLTNGTSYTFNVSPSGNSTSSTASTTGSNAVTPSAALAAPTVATAGGGAIKVTFTADGVASTYTVTSTPGSKTCVVANTTTAPTGTQSCTVSGLSDGTSYTFHVKPTGNSTGSTQSAESTSITTLSAFTGTSITAVAASSTSVKVSFTPDGTATTYVVNSYSGSNYDVAGPTCTLTSTTAIAATATSCTVTGLGSSTSYEFTVTPSGNGETLIASALTSAVTPGSVLATPVATTAGPAKMLVTFTADGVATTYTVTSSGGQTCTVANTQTIPTGSQSCTVSGLTNNVGYTFHVAASGGGTSSSQSAESVSVTATTQLAKPTVVNAGLGSIKVTFTADGVVGTYTVTASSDSKTCVISNTTTAPSGTQTCTVTGLTNGKAYTFTVVPSNVNGSSSTTSPSSNSIAPGLAALATPTVAYAADGAIKVSFVPDGTATTYTVNSASTVSAAASGSCTVTNSSTPPSGAQSCTVTGLTDGDAYTFTVTPTGNGTTSLVSAASASIVASASTVPAAPASASATGGTANIVVSWTAPTNTGGSAITGYSVTAVSGNSTTTCGTVAATATTCTISGLAAGTYAVSVSAINANGTGAAAAASATVVATVVIPPPAPTFRVIKMIGHAVPGRTVLAVLVGRAFYGQPTVRSNVGGVRVGVSGDTGTVLIIHITTARSVRRGVHTFTVTLADGTSGRVNYVTR